MKQTVHRLLLVGETKIPHADTGIVIRSLA